MEWAAEIAEKHGTWRTHITRAWLLQKEPVTAPIVGPTKIEQLEEAVSAVSVKITPEDTTHREEGYIPHRIVGQQRRRNNNWNT